MPRFIDIHTGMKGVTKQQLATEHQKDIENQKTEGVRFIKAWADPQTGKVFCLSEGPSRDAVLRVHKKAGHATEEIYEVPIEIE
jgi:hypothetical protein